MIVSHKTPESKRGALRLFCFLRFYHEVMCKTQKWLAIAIGNTNIRAVIFSHDLNGDRQILDEYSCTHDQLATLETQLAVRDYERIAIASVVPKIITCWHSLDQTQIITTPNVPLYGLYSTMGVDRALAAFGAGEAYGYPVLVIDAGTALTFTGIDVHKTLVGGAIIGGVRSQFSSLHQNTAALPDILVPDHLPPRWATDTVSAMQSGVAHILLAGLQAYIDDWRSQFPDSQVVITGGDRDRLVQWGLQVDIIDKNLILLGLLHCV